MQCQAPACFNTPVLIIYWKLLFASILMMFNLLKLNYSQIKWATTWICNDSNQIKCHSWRTWVLSVYLEVTAGQDGHPFLPLEDVDDATSPRHLRCQRGLDCLSGPACFTWIRHCDSWRQLHFLVAWSWSCKRVHSDRFALGESKPTSSRRWCCGR